MAVRARRLRTRRLRRQRRCEHHARREPIGATTTLSAQGLAAPGTLAAGYWFANAIAPALGDATDTWTVVEWTDGDGDHAPSAADSFIPIASGS